MDPGHHWGKKLVRIRNIGNTFIKIMLPFFKALLAWHATFNHFVILNRVLQFTILLPPWFLYSASQEKRTRECLTACLHFTNWATLHPTGTELSWNPLKLRCTLLSYDWTLQQCPWTTLHPTCGTLLATLPLKWTAYLCAIFKLLGCPRSGQAGAQNEQKCWCRN